MALTLVGVSEAAGTGSSLTLPWPETPIAGDVAILFQQHRNLVNPTSGWDALGYMDRSDNRLRAESKVCVGGESSLALVPFIGRRLSCALYLLRDVGSVEVLYSSNSMAGSPDFPSSSPSWGLKETLWIISAGSYYVDRNFSLTAPSGYTRVSPTSSPNSFASAYRILEAASEDPGVWITSLPLVTTGFFIAVSGTTQRKRRRQSSGIPL
jgi:hypothetical protein